MSGAVCIVKLFVDGEEMETWEEPPPPGVGGGGMDTGLVVVVVVVVVVVSSSFVHAVGFNVGGDGWGGPIVVVESGFLPVILVFFFASLSFFS